MRTDPTALSMILARILILAASCVAATGCGGGAAPARPEAPPPPAPGVVLDIDGLWITAEEIDRAVAAQRLVEPNLGLDSTRRNLLEVYLIPLAKSRRDHAERLAELEETARALSASAENYAELKEKAARMRFTEEKVIRPFGQFPPVLDWVFRPENLGRTSPPLPTWDGFLVVACKDIETGLTSVMQDASVFMVTLSLFAGKEEQQAWFATVRQDLAGKLRYVHPDYRDALPRWLE